MKDVRKLIVILMAFIVLMLVSSCKSCKPTIHTYKEPYEWKEEEINIQTGAYQLPGKLTLPITNYPVPAVVFVHGSGASDMNESVGALQLFADLSKQLAKKGVASIRYDKRTYRYAEELATKLDFTVNDEVIDDAVSAIQLLEQNASIGDIYIIGHSFGGQLAPVIANQTKVKGVIVLAGTLEHIIDVAMEQLKEQNSPYYDVYDPYDTYFRNIKEVVPNEIGYFFMGAYEIYWVSYNQIDIRKETLRCAENKKMLILQGGLDLQVKATQLESYQTLLASTNAQYVRYEVLNHMFVDGTGESIQTAYQIHKEVPIEVIMDILSFIKE